STHQCEKLELHSLSLSLSVQTREFPLVFQLHKCIFIFLFTNFFLIFAPTKRLPIILPLIHSPPFFFTRAILIFFFIPFSSKPVSISISYSLIHNFLLTVL
ncbi:hypothetical protein PanWU01x14_106690, partial [Parasponia andersonii]